MQLSMSSPLQDDYDDSSRNSLKDKFQSYKNLKEIL